MNIYGKDIKIDRKMGKILLESNVIEQEEYQWIKQLLQKQEEPIVKKSDIEELDSNKQSFLESTLFKKLYKTASSEWYIVGCVEDKEKKECSLCGERDTIKKFYIKNKINGKEMNVGSTCVNKIDDIRGMDGKSKEEIEKEYILRQRDQIMNNLHNGIIEKIENWNKRFDEIPTVVPEIEEKKYFDLARNIQNVYSKYKKKSKVDYKLIEEIYQFVLKGDEVILEIYGDIEKKKDNEWYINENITKWHDLENTDSNLTKFLKDDGFITPKSACRIYEINFVHKMIEKLKELFADSSVDILDYDEKDKTIIYTIDKRNIYNNRIELKCPYTTFMREYVDKVFEDTKVNKITEEERKFLIVNGIINDNSISAAIRNLRYILDKNNISIISWDTNYDEVVIKRELNSKIVQIMSLKKFVQQYKNEVFAKEIETVKIKEIKKYIQTNAKEMEEKEYKSIVKERIRQEEKMQNKYDFAKYKI